MKKWRVELWYHYNSEKIGSHRTAVEIHADNERRAESRAKVWLYRNTYYFNSANTVKPYQTVEVDRVSAKEIE